jgi:hypothetical protein
VSPTNYFDSEPRPQQTGFVNLAEVYADLATGDRLARALNVNKFRLKNWMVHRDKFQSPLPVLRFGHIDVYSIVEWQDWLVRWEKLNSGDRRVVESRAHGAGEAFWSYFEGE